MKPITQIKVSFFGIAKGERKSLHHLLHVANLDGRCDLSPDDFNEFERKAWKIIEEKGYRITPNDYKSKHYTAQLCAYEGSYDEKNDIVMLKMLPTQQHIIMKKGRA